MPTDICSSPTGCGSDTSNRSTATGRWRICLDENRLEYLQIDGRPSERTVKGVISLMGAMGEDDPRPGPERRYMESIPYGAGDPNERLGAARQGEPRRRAAVRHDRAAVGVRGDRPRADAGLLPRVQPVDRRLLPRLGRPAERRRPPDAARPRGIGRRAAARRGRRMRRCVGRAVHPHPQGARPPRPRRPVAHRQRAGRSGCGASDLRARRSAHRSASTGSAAPPSSTTTSCCAKAASRRCCRS